MQRRVMVLESVLTAMPTTYVPRELYDRDRVGIASQLDAIRRELVEANKRSEERDAEQAARTKSAVKVQVAVLVAVFGALAATLGAAIIP